MYIAQLSDLHVVADAKRLYDFVETNSVCAEAFAYLKGSSVPFDCIVISGDTVNCGTKAAYAMLERILDACHKPLFTIPGNHDTPHFLRTIAKGRYHRATGTKMDYVVDDYPLRLVFLDTTSPGDVHGILTADQLAWVSDTLKNNEKPTMIFMHHHPVSTGNAHMDPIFCRNGQELIDLVRSFPHLQAISCGHTHRAIFQRRSGVTVMTAPSLVTGIVSDFHDAKGYFYRTESSFLIHRYIPEEGLISFVETIPQSPIRSFQHVVSCPKTGEA